MSNDIVQLGKDLDELGLIGEEGFELLMNKKPIPERWLAVRLSMLDEIAKPKAAVENVVVQMVRELLVAAAEQEKRKTMSPEEWKKMVKDLAAPKKK